MRRGARRKQTLVLPIGVILIISFYCWFFDLIFCPLTTHEQVFLPGPALAAFGGPDPSFCPRACVAL